MSNDEKVSSTFCVMPWMNLATETNGKCKICCVVMTNKYIKDKDGQDYHIQKNEITEIWNSDYVKNVRKKMLAGEWVSDCFYCKKQESVGSTSPRQEYTSRWDSPQVQARVEESKLKDGHVTAMPMSLEPRPGITCNLKCNMCWSLSSSKVFLERKEAIEKNLKTPGFLKKSWEYEVKEAEQSDFKWADSPTYLDNIRKCMPELKRLYFTGGEPTLIKSNINLLKELLERDQRNLLVSFTTNLNYEKSELVDLALRFTHVEITGSIDAIGAANSYIRYPSKWELIEKNLYFLTEKSYAGGFSIMSVFQLCNVFSFLDMIEWLARNKTLKSVRVIITMLQGPEFLRPEILPQNLKEKAYKRIDALLEMHDVNEHNKQGLHQIKSQLSMTNSRQEALLKDFSEYIQFMDSIRNTRFHEVFPELRELVKL